MCSETTNGGGMQNKLAEKRWQVKVYQTGAVTFWFDVYGSKRKAQREAANELRLRKRKSLRQEGSLYRTMQARLVHPAHGLQVQINILDLN